MKKIFRVTLIGLCLTAFVVNLGANTNIFIEYEEQPDNKAYFLDHYDALKIKAE